MEIDVPYNLNHPVYPVSILYCSLRTVRVGRGENKNCKVLIQFNLLGRVHVR